MKLVTLGVAGALSVFALGAHATALTSNGVTFDDLDAPGVAITGLTGDGTEGDKFVLSEDMSGMDETIEITGIGSISEVGSFTSGFWIEKVVTNDSVFAWNSFDLELQEILGVPSPDGDGLSFAQGFAGARPFTSSVFSSVFEESSVRDQISFFNGVVNPGETVSFMFAITDTTPTSPFYLRQRPNFIDPEAQIPVPAALPLLASAVGGLAFLRRRNKRS